MIMKLRKRLLKRSKRKGQTALEYALVVGAISLVVMFAWNKVGKEVQSSIEGSILSEIKDNLEGGNARSF